MQVVLSWVRQPAGIAGTAAQTESKRMTVVISTLQEAAGAAVLHERYSEGPEGLRRYSEELQRGCAGEALDYAQVQKQIWISSVEQAA